MTNEQKFKNGSMPKRKEKPMESSNIKAMRDALKETQSAIAKCMEILNRIPDGVEYDGLIDEVADELCDLRESHVKPALSTPLCNFDVGTAEEQAKRFSAFCGRYRSQSGIKGMCSSLCPCFWCCDMCHCLTKWSQMPYEKGEVK